MRCALQAQTSHLHLSVTAKFNQKTFLENYFLHHGNRLLRLNDSRPKKNHQLDTSQQNSRCSLLTPIPSGLSITVLQTTAPRPRIPLPLARALAVGICNSRAAASPQSLCLPVPRVVARAKRGTQPWLSRRLVVSQHPFLWADPRV